MILVMNNNKRERNILNLDVQTEFESEQIRNKSIRKLAKPSFKFKTTKIWAEKDLEYKFRQLISFLLAIRKDCIDRGLDKVGLWIDKEQSSLSYYDEEIMTTYIDGDGQMQQQINPEWMDYMIDGKFEELKL